MKARFSSVWIFLCVVWFASVSQAAMLITTNSNWRFRPGGSEASTPNLGTWRVAGFNDAEFVAAPAPFWYGDVRDGGTQLTGMQNNYGCIFLRRSFTITNLAEISGLRLGAFVDDGFAAWINGFPVQAVNLTNTVDTPIRYTDFAINATEPVPFVLYNLPPLSSTNYLVLGENWLAVQVFNTSLGSSDLGFDCQLESLIVETNPPVVVGRIPVPGTVTNLTSVTVTFSEPVTGVEAGALLVNSYPATTVSGTGAVYTFSFSQPAYGPVNLGWSANFLIADLAFPPNPFDGAAPAAQWIYTLLDVVPPTAAVYPAPGSVVRTLRQVEVVFSENVMGVEAGDLLVNGVPATNLMVQPLARYLFQFAEPPQGAVQFAWAAGHGITDLAVPPQPFAGGSWSCQLDANAVPGDLIINEICANNQHGLEDEDVDPGTGHGENQDWIEIYNRGSNAVDLANWSLSDDPDNPGQWVFPSRVLGPGQFLVVFISGKDRTSPTGTNRFHTNFQLADNGEFLGLYNAESPRLLVSGFSPGYPDQRMDYSYGYDRVGNLRYFATPTPGAPNGDSTITGLCAPVHFSTPRGYYTQPFDLYLTTATRGAAIFYTTNGYEPAWTGGILYTGKIRMAQTTLLRAAAFRTNFLPSTVSTHTYLFNQSAAMLSLPIISLVTAETNLTGRTGIIGINGGTRDGSGLWASTGPNDYHNPSQHGLAWERPISCEYLVPADNSGFQADCGIRVQGSDYQRPRTYPTSKFSFRLYFRGDYGLGRLDYPLFPLTQARNFDQIVLRAGFNDPSNPFIRDELTRRLSHDEGQVSAHGTLVNLFINGVYKGYYNPCERVHEEFAQNYYGGSDKWDVVSPTFASGSGAPGVVDGDRSAFVSLVNYINAQNPANQDVYREISRRLDLVNYVDYLLLNVYASMGDWPANNFRAGHDRAGGPFRFWVWDGEWGFGIYNRAVTDNTFTLSGPGPNDSGLATTSSEIAQIYQRLRLNPEFRLLFADRIQKQFFNDGALTDANIVRRFNELRTNLLGILPNMETAIITSWVPQRRGIVMGFFQSNGLQSSVPAPAFNQFGGRVPQGFAVSITASGNAIYYTTNGADPRVMFTGAIAPDARLYTSAVSIMADLPLRARALSGTNWSALTESRFQVAVLVPLRITEINYHPPAGNADEFIEIKNFGGASVDVSGCYFEGIDYRFPVGTVMAPGDIWVLASDSDTNNFTANHPGVRVAGWFGGQLANGGELIALHDPSGRVIMAVAYDDEGGWPLAADGLGPTLEILDPMGDPNEPANWRASANHYGTPGIVTPPPPPPDVRINEIMADNLTAVTNGATHPDWIELQNVSANAVDISNWSLTDDGNPLKFVFPTNTSVPAGGFLVIWCDDVTNATPGLHAGFALNREGDRIFLYDVTGTRVDAVSYGQQLTDYSLGRLGSDWTLTTPTPNAANAAVPLGNATNLVINEWMANPPAGQSDWLELYNRSTNRPVGLRGLGLLMTNGAQTVAALAFVPPGGFAVLSSGSAHSPLANKLPASGTFIILLDATGAEIGRVSFGAQSEGISSGRLPDGSANIVNFPGSASPGAPNYLRPTSGLRINEVLARNVTAATNQGHTADFIELFNGAATNADLGGMSLSLGQANPGAFIFPTGTVLASGGYLVVWCDDERPVSLMPGDFNLGLGVDGDGDAVYLFRSSGWLADMIAFGPQVPDKSVGLTGGQWQLLAQSTPGVSNAPPQTLRTNSQVRLNEWMANPVSGPDWFELYNPADGPVELSGLYVSDDWSAAGQVAYPLPPLSYLGSSNYLRLVADADPGEGANHVGFRIDAQGDNLLLIRSNAGVVTVVDAVSFGTQPQGIALGRLPDGSSNFAAFPGSASPGEPNYLLLPNVVINEIFLAATAAGNAIEVQNTGSTPLDIGGWQISDSAANFRQWTIPSPAEVPAGSFLVFYESAFSAGFKLDRTRGGELWLSATDAGGALTGWQTKANYGPTAPDTSVGRINLPNGVDYLPLAGASLGSSNGPPAVGPVVFNELMYHPPDSATGEPAEEYVELLNAGSQTVALADAARPGVSWRLRGGASFDFPSGASLMPGAVAVVVGFDPADLVALGRFRARYNVPANAMVFGPFNGRLADEGERLELLKPEASVGDLVPYSLVERLDYGSSLPWPAAANGGGASLHRLNSLGLANDPAHWVAGAPSPGSTNLPPAEVPVITAGPQNLTANEQGSAAFSVAATGTGLSYQWRFFGAALSSETNAILVLDGITLDDEGPYDVVVTTPSASRISPPALLDVLSPPQFASVFSNRYVRVGSNVVAGVSLFGAMPMTFQWRRNGVTIPGQTGSTLIRTNFQIADEGWYEVAVTNQDGSATYGASLLASLPLGFSLSPQSLTVLPGEQVTLSIIATGYPGPVTVEWRNLTNTIFTNIVLQTPNSLNYTNFYSFSLFTNQLFFRARVSNPAQPTNGPQSGIVIIRAGADNDQDGLLDSWEAAYGFNTNSAADAFLDSDGDGMSNWAEYRAGTNPGDALSRLWLGSVPAGANAVFGFLVPSNHTAALQFSGDLSSGDWQTSARFVATQTNRSEQIQLPLVFTNRYYRLAVPATPE